MKRIKDKNLLLYIPLLILNIISLLNMQNAKLIDNIYQNILIKQLLWFTIGYITIYIIKKININNIFKYSNYLYLFSLSLLVLVLFFGKNINGSKCWLNILGFTFQPSELMKLALVIYFINIIKNIKINTFKDEIIIIFKLLFLTLIPSLLVFLEPDTGAIINYLIILFITLIYLKLNKLWYIFSFIITSTIIITFILCYFFNQDLLINTLGTSIFYRIERVINFTNGNNYQLEQALINIGASSLLGVGLNKILLYIPEAPTDFIFAFSTSNFGIISSIIIILSYLLINLFFIFKINKTKNKIIKLYLYLLLGLFIFPEIYNISMNLGLLPIMGIPLPFLSYGGSQIIINYIFIAIALKLLN